MQDLHVVMDIVRDQDEYLILHKAPRYREQRQRYRENPWGIPGGKIEGKQPYSSQDIIEAGHRELIEETGLDGTAVRTASPYDRTQEEKDRTLAITFYPVLLTVQSREIDLGHGMETPEHEEAAWVDRDRFRQRLTQNEITALESLERS